MSPPNKTDLNGNLQDNLHWLLIRVSLHAKHKLMEITEEYDLTVMQVFTLFILEPGAEVPMHSISGLLSCDPSNVTAIVDRLVGNSYIERNESAADRRVKAVSLTERGKSLRQEILERMVKENIPDISSLSSAEAKTLKKLLLKIEPANSAE
jgi:DNA-binding MarR family transcriptional regulator